MKENRKCYVRTALIFCCTVFPLNTKGFVLRTTLSQKMIDPGPYGNCENKTFRTKTNLASNVVGDPSNLPSSKNIPASSPKSMSSEEFNWLNWVYKQWASTPTGELSEEILKQMVPAISRWGQRTDKGSADRAEELLERIIQENLAMNPHAALNVTMFNAAMHGYSKIGNPLGAQRILRRMETLRTTCPHLDYLKPDAISMSTLVTAWAKSKSPKAINHALNILNYMDMENICPNVITYNSVLHALATGHQNDKAILAEDIVKEMERRSELDHDCKPDIFSYQCLIQAWANTPLPGSPQRAEQILRLLDVKAERGSFSLEPNAHCFTAAIHAWARSSERNRAKSAFVILRHMTERYEQLSLEQVKPTVVAFTAVLNACSRPANSAEREEAFHIAQLTMSQLSSGIYDKPNFLSYAAFFSVCATTVDEGVFRDRTVRTIFEQCVETGQVGQIVVQKLKDAASRQLFDELVGKYENDRGSFDLPRAWTSSLCGERKIGGLKPRPSKLDPIPQASKLRLREVKKFRGTSGYYSKGTCPKLILPDGVRP